MLSIHRTIAVIFAFKFLQFVDRSVANGAPAELMEFIQRAINRNDAQALLFAYIASIYVVGTVTSCIVSVWLLARGAAPHALLRQGIVLWTVGVFLSASCYALPAHPASYYAFLAARVVAGLGGGAVTVTWPPYIETIAIAGEKSMSMTVVEMGTSLGAATGFVYSAAMAVTVGWGVAYLVGLQTFLPNIAVSAGLWPSEVVAGISVGGGIVVGAVLGAPAHGIVAEWLGRRYGRRTEASRLLLLIGFTSAASAFGAAAGLYYVLLSHRPWLADAMVAVLGAFLLGSLGLQVRLPLLLVGRRNPQLRPLATLTTTFVGYIGEFLGPLIAGSLKDGLAPHCAVEEGGEVGALCGSEEDQKGLRFVAVAVCLMAVVGGGFWLLAGGVQWVKEKNELLL